MQILKTSKQERKSLFMWWKMELITTSKGGRKLIRNNFMYQLNKTLENSNTCWECDRRQSGSGCKAKVVLDQQNNFLRQSGKHTHAPDPEKVSIEKSRSVIKRAAIGTNASTNNIIAANIAGVTNNILAKLPRMETMRRDVRRQRATHAACPPIPDDGNTLFDIPQRFTVTSTEDEFLKYDDQRVDRNLIFGTGRSLNILQNSDNWFMDWTFLTAPPQFAQLYTVRGLSHGRHIVGANGLLPNKRLDTCNEFLTQIRNLTNHVNPQSVIIDFEQFMMGALDQVYPVVPQKGCLFYLSKNVYKRVQDEGMSQLYMNDEEFRTNIRMISALSFVPIADTIQALSSRG